ncbi:MAG: DUF4010 domain-containing protein [Gemmatimonadota bacterium]
MDPATPILIRDFAIALFIGALVGLDRELKKMAEGDQGMGGIRTFALFAMAGAVGAWLSRELGTPWVFIAVFSAVAAAVVVGYFIQVREGLASSGMTTEIAAIVVCLLGGLTMFGYPAIAVVLGIAVSAILAFKQPIHGAVGRIGTEDLYAILKLLIASFIILPLLPNDAIDPLGALNPNRLWLLVVFISGLSLLGYLGVRLLGPGRGTALTGLLGGMVSSTAVTLAFSRQSKEGDGGAHLGSVLAAGILLAWLVMFVRVLVEVAVVHATMLPELLVPMVAMALVSLIAAGWYLRESQVVHTGPAVASTVPLRNPFNLTAAIKFALFFAAVLVVVKLVERYFPGPGFYPVAGLAGLTDVDAITLSMAGFVRDGGDLVTGRNAIVIAVLSNTLVKGGMVLALAAPALRRRVTVAVALVMVAGVGALLV